MTDVNNGPATVTCIGSFGAINFQQFKVGLVKFLPLSWVDLNGINLFTFCHQLCSQGDLVHECTQFHRVVPYLKYPNPNLRAFCYRPIAPRCGDRPFSEVTPEPPDLRWLGIDP